MVIIELTRADTKTRKACNNSVLVAPPGRTGHNRPASAQGGQLAYSRPTQHIARVLMMSKNVSSKIGWVILGPWVIDLKLRG